MLGDGGRYSGLDKSDSGAFVRMEFVVWFGITHVSIMHN
jgi:hypothetical protein